jgi:DNA-binding IclR family transcriptional regulator
VRVLGLGTDSTKRLGGVTHALAVLALLKDAGGPLGVRQIARDIGISPTSVHRILKSFEAYGFVQQSVTERTYSLGWGLLAYSSAVLAMTQLATVAADSARTLRDTTRETVTVQERVGSDRVCVLSIEGTHELRRQVSLGRRLPLFAGASGRAILAFMKPEDIDRLLDSGPLRFAASGEVVDRAWIENDLEAIRRTGLALSVGETVAGVSSAATPILRFDGEVVGSIAVSGPAGRWTVNAITSHRDDLIDIGAQLSRRMGFRGALPWAAGVSNEERRSFG